MVVSIFPQERFNEQLVGIQIKGDRVFAGLIVVQIGLGVLVAAQRFYMNPVPDDQPVRASVFRVFFGQGNWAGPGPGAAPPNPPATSLSPPTPTPSLPP